MQFTTERLVVRKPIPEDAKDIFENYATDLEVTKYITWIPHKTPKETEDWIRFCIDGFEPEKWISLVIVLKGEERVIGMLDFRIDGFQAKFGYVLAKKYWNQGIMTEAMRAVFDYVFTLPGIYRIEAGHDTENEASGKVMQKLGMELEGVRR